MKPGNAAKEEKIMWTWLKKLLGMETSEADHVKSFDEATADMSHKEYQRAGQQSIETRKIVGSVGRAHELDSDFHYRDRTQTGRFRRIEQDMLEGKPMEPIKVVRVKREDRDSEYFVLDGHHRVAVAKEDGLESMNADVVDVKPGEDEFEEHHDT
jgi:hypothetical protein